MQNKHRRLMRAVFSSPWAIMPEKLEEIVAFLELRLTGSRPSDAEIAEFAAQAAAATAPNRVAGTIAVLPLLGTISQRAGMMTNFSGGTSTEIFAKAFRSALADESVRAIVLDVDSPGGTVYGVDELAGEIFRARGKKPIVAAVNSLAASAAYWIASAADEIAVTPGGEVGSIGVYAMHVDESQLDEKVGLKITLISAGKFKTEGNPFEPLSGDARGAIQKRVDEYYDMFAGAVVRNRSTTAAAARKGFGEGRVVGAKEAVELGMADRIATLDQILARLAGGSQRRKMAEAEEAAPEGVAPDMPGPPAPGAGAIPAHTTATSDEPWDGPTNEARLPSERGPLRQAHAWIDPERDPDTKAAYRFIHHEVGTEGNVDAANMTACSTGIGVLNGGRGGTTIPDEDRQGVYDHLARHLKDGGKNPPPLASAGSRQKLALERRRLELYPKY